MLLDFLGYFREPMTGVCFFLQRAKNQTNITLEKVEITCMN